MVDRHEIPRLTRDLISHTLVVCSTSILILLLRFLPSRRRFDCRVAPPVVEVSLSCVSSSSSLGVYPSTYASAVGIGLLGPQSRIVRSVASKLLSLKKTYQKIGDGATNSRYLL